MPKTMLVNVTHVEESRVAILEDGVLDAYEIETLNRAQIKGNIYNAVVESVHPSLEAAFVRLGPDRKGFLPLDEVNFRLLPSRAERGKGGKIGQHLRQGQKLMAQVVREPFAGKPPTVSTYFSLPGRYLVLMPGVDSAGVSRKIADGAQRDRLKKIVDELDPPDGFGIIVRTAGMGQTKTELQRDLRYLLRLWESVQRNSKSADFPGLVYQERDLVIRTIRDYFTPDIREVWIDSEETHERALKFVKGVMPTKAKIIHRYTGERPLFNRFNLEEQIESIYKRRVSLKSGGEIVIDGTEALTAIDVNSARSQRKADVEDTSTQTNLEAAAEIARQFRLRDLGGLIVIDFIDMNSTKNKKKVEKAMRDAMRGDRARHNLTPISKLGLMEIARQRLKSEKIRSSYLACPNCEGFGLVKTVEASALAAFRKLQTRSARGGIARIRLSLPEEVAEYILNQKRADLNAIETRHDLTVEIVSDPKLLRHESVFQTTSQEAAARSAAEDPMAAAAAAIPAIPPMPTAEPESAAADDQPAEAKEDKPAEEPPKRRRRARRRRRGGRGSKATSQAKASQEPSPGGSKSPAAEPEEKETKVPRGVSSQELMPAASAGSGRSRSKSSRRGSGRRRSGKTRPKS